jgi:hypothetical protein
LTVRATQLALLFAFLVLWEVAPRLDLINPLFTSYPSTIWPTFLEMLNATPQQASILSHTWATQNKAGKAWSMGIADPNKENKILAWLNLQDMALVTSGDYQKYFIHDGKRYGHILDPRTGYPALGLKSVSILCPDAELADALATAVYVMGADKGMDLINQLHGVEGLVITDDDRVLESENLTLNYYAATD